MHQEPMTFTSKRKVSTACIMGLHVGVMEFGKQCMPSLQQNAVPSSIFSMKHYSSNKPFK